MAISQEEQMYLDELDAELAKLPANSPTQNPYYATAMFGNSGKQNLVEWQLDFRPELEDIEHLLRCDVLRRDQNGIEFWEQPFNHKWVRKYVIDSSAYYSDPTSGRVLQIIRVVNNQHEAIIPQNEMNISEVISEADKFTLELIRQPDTSVIVFNGQAVNDILRLIRMTLNKNTVLSNYREEQITMRVRMLGHELRALIYNNAERYGIDNEYKQNNYPIMVVTILSMVESAFRRSINGEERRDLNQARVVQQTEQPMQQQNPYGMMMVNNNQQNKKKWFKPWSW